MILMLLNIVFTLIGIILSGFISFWIAKWQIEKVDELHTVLPEPIIQIRDTKEYTISQTNLFKITNESLVLFDNKLNRAEYRYDYIVKCLKAILENNYQYSLCTFYCDDFVISVIPPIQNRSIKRFLDRKIKRNEFESSLNNVKTYHMFKLTENGYEYSI
jgi:hypothetical protein